MPEYERLKFFVWNNVHTLPVWQIRIWQSLHFRRLIEHAYAHIPLYRALWNERGLTEKTVKKMRNLRLLPTVSKETFIRNTPEAYVYNYSPTYPYEWLSTSGSTGTPFRFIFPASGNGSHEIERLYIIAKRWRFLEWDGIPFNEILLTNVVKMGDRQWFDLPGIYVSTEEFRSRPKEILNEIYPLRAKAIFGFVSKIIEFCSAIRERNMVGVISFPYCSTTGEVLTQDQRNFIRDTLSCDVYDRYATTELRTIGIECREHKGFHLSSESLILEVVDERGNSLPPNTEGKIVVTNLFNKIMPFIRYETGDRGAILSKKCPCGLATQLFSVAGRRRTIRFGTKNLYYGDLNGLISKHVNAILQWQVKKLSEKHAEFIFVKGKTYTLSTERQVFKALERLLGKEMRIDMRAVSNMQLTTAGKTDIFIDASKSESSMPQH